MCRTLQHRFQQLGVTSRSKPEGDLPTSRYLSKAWYRCFEPRVQQSVTVERLWKFHHRRSYRQIKQALALGTEQRSTGVTAEIACLWQYDEGRKHMCRWCLQIQR